jgi:hypothetical protein
MNTRSLLCRASAEYRDLAGKLRELARACIFPGPGEVYCGLRDRLDRRATRFECRAARGENGALPHLPS